MQRAHSENILAEYWGEGGGFFMGQKGDVNCIHSAISTILLVLGLPKPQYEAAVVEKSTHSRILYNSTRASLAIQTLKLELFMGP